MKVNEIKENIVGHKVMLIEVDDFPGYNGMIGTVLEDEKRGYIFNPIIRQMRNRGKSFNPIPLKPSDMIEPLDW
ncbi:MAG: hypothetical protein ACM34K_15395 [Bacillota bacterium]